MNIYTGHCQSVAQTLSRASWWGVAAHVFRYPSRDHGPESVLPRATFDGVPPDVASTIGAPLEYLREMWDSTPPLDRELAYVQVFGHTVRTKTTPYEAEWGEMGGLLLPHRLADIRAFYHAHGLTPGPGGERPDHISVECEYLQFLAVKEACALISGEEEHAECCHKSAALFLGEHLAAFAPALARRILKSGPPKLYAAAAHVLLALVESEARAFGAAAGSESLPLRTFSVDEESGCISCTNRKDEDPEHEWASLP